MSALTPQGINHQRQRVFNRGLIFQLLATEDSMSRTELANRSGLTKMTLSNIIADFIQRGYVIEYTEKSPGPHNPIKLAISPQAPKVVGVMIHRTHVSAALCDLRLNVLESRRVAIEAYDEEALIHTAFQLTDQMVARDQVLGIGIASVGPVDINNGVILNPPNFCGLHDIPVAGRFRRRYDLPVYFNHHLNCNALAERFYGNGRAYHDFIFLCVDHDINLGIVTGNQLYNDSTGFSSEIGRVLVNYMGPGMGGEYLGGVGDYIRFELCQDNPNRLYYMVDMLAAVMGGICDLLNPQAIILGGEEGLFGPEQAKQFATALNQRLAIHAYRHIDVLPAFRTQNLEASSSAISVIRQIFKGELLV